MIKAHQTKEEEIEVTWGEKGESKGEEGNQASNHTHNGY